MNQNVIASYALISQLKNLGVKTAVVSPGSRNTPLAYSANEILETIVLIDERDAGFCALGIAESTNTPTVVITTSGSAPTHLFPSVAESFGSNIPLIVISADRPHDIRGRGAPQTIDQVDLFTTHVRYFYDAPIPSEDVELDFWIDLASDIYNASVGSLKNTNCAGPVHLNMGFDENLVPDGDEATFVDGYYKNEIDIPSEKIFGFLSKASQVSETKKEDIDVSREVRILFERAKKILFTFGRNSIPDQKRETILKTLSGFPVLCDATSQMRFSEDVIATYDAIVRKMEIQSLKPDLVIQIGDCLTSKKLNEFLSGLETVVIKTQIDGRNPYGNITHTAISPDISAFIEKLVGNETQTNSEYFDLWKSNDENAEKILLELINKNSLSEPALMSKLGNSLENSGSQFDVLLGSSMPVRNGEWFWPNIDFENRVFAHRGTNGIDGFISSLFGIAMGSKNRTIGVCGDLTFTHDLGFLPHCANLSKEYGKDITIFVIDNDGGAIFTHLNQRKSQILSESYEKLIATPPKIDLQKIAIACGADYRDLDLEKVESEIESLLSQKNVGTRVVRIQVDHMSGLDFMNQLNTTIA